MNQERLMQSPLPLTRLALRVVLPAEREDLWQPQPKPADNKKFSRNALAIADFPAGGVVVDVVGKRRDRMTVLGYAAEQGSKTKTRWVVRCDCGNFEHRKRILRWLGTEAPDMCAECKTRSYKIGGSYSAPRAPAKRATASSDKAGTGR